MGYRWFGRLLIEGLLLRFSQEPQCSGFANRIAPAIDTQLTVDITGVDFDRVGRDKEPLANFTIG